MFPLGSVLFPGQVLPLHVFEERYQAMIRHCVRTDQPFGVVLIERGSEVGGGDVRSDVGTLATIVRAHEFRPGHWSVAAVGTRRVRVDRWEPDAPWPQAELSEFPDADSVEVSSDVDSAVQAERAWIDVRDKFHRVWELAMEQGAPALPDDFSFDPSPAQASFEVSAVAPLGPFDRQRVLAADGVLARLTLLSELLDDLADLLRGAGGIGDWPGGSRPPGS